MARWNEEHERSMAEQGRHGEEQRSGRWQGGGREWEDRGRERWTSGERGGEEWRAGSRGDEWRGGREPWPGGREYERGGEHGDYGRGGMRAGEWERDRDERWGGGYERGRPGERGGRGLGEGWRGEEGDMGERGPSYGAGGMYGGAGGAYGGSPGGGITGAPRGGSGYGIGEYAGYRGYGQGRRERGGGWPGERGGWRDTSRDLARDLRHHGEDEGPFERIGERMKEGWRKITGRGPKGFKRSDERIREDVSERLARSGVNAEEVEVKVEKGEVTLTGFVDSREDKRLIEDIADDVFGADEVINNLRVRRGERQTFTAGQPQTSGTQTAGAQRTSQATQPPSGRH